MIHVGLDVGDVVVRQIAGGAIDVVDVQPRQVHRVQHQSGIVTQSTRVGHVDGKLMCKITILHQRFVRLVGDQGMRVEVFDGALVVVVCITPGIPHLSKQKNTILINVHKNIQEQNSRMRILVWIYLLQSLSDS